MKLALTIWLLLFTFPYLAQGQTGQSSKRKLKLENIDDPAILSQQLVASCSSEREKVTVIFRWITDNIAYYKPGVRRKKKHKLPTLTEIPDEGELPSLTERVARRVLQDKSAVCDGYSRLFKSLCEHAGIPVQIVTGYARTSMDGPQTKFRSNHTWNAVYFDSSWHLVDVTWASGYISWPSRDFIRLYDEYYFLTPPEKFIQHHYPDDFRWTLMDDPPAISEFYHTPFRQRSFNKYAITAYFPSKGIIETRVGDTIRLELETIAAERNRSISADSLWDSTSLLQAPSFAYVRPESTDNGSKVLYNFPVGSENIQWLYVMYNNDAVLRYRLNIRKEKPAGEAAQ